MLKLGQTVIFTPRATYGLTWDRRHYLAVVTGVNARAGLPTDYTVQRLIPGGDCHWSGNTEDEHTGASVGTVRGDGWQLVLERGEGLEDITCVYALEADARSAYRAALHAPRNDVRWTTLFELHDGEMILADMQPSADEAKRLVS